MSALVLVAVPEVKLEDLEVNPVLVEDWEVNLDLVEVLEVKQDTLDSRTCINLPFPNLNSRRDQTFSITQVSIYCQ